MAEIAEINCKWQLGFNSSVFVSDSGICVCTLKWSLSKSIPELFRLHENHRKIKEKTKSNETSLLEIKIVRWFLQLRPSYSRNSQ